MVYVQFILDVSNSEKLRIFKIKNKYKYLIIDRYLVYTTPTYTSLDNEHCYKTICLQCVIFDPR